VPLLSYLDDGDDFPPSSEALREPNGLLAAGGCLDADTLLRAYGRGIFPWYEAPQPILWWTPDPRSVLFPAELRVSRSLRRRLRRNEYALSVDRCFREVMQGCAGPRAGQRGTWIDSAMIDAYSALHAAGHAHSIEVHRDGELVGGLYGVLLGRVFFGESMFSRASDTSKIALVALARALGPFAEAMIDCQVESDHLVSLGARPLSRVDFEQRLAQTRCMPTALLNVPPSCGELV
jgi:leucyl/phenylalanyl-tRNA--protein transferase